MPLVVRRAARVKENLILLPQLLGNALVDVRQLALFLDDEAGRAGVLDTLLPIIRQDAGRGGG